MFRQKKAAAAVALALFALFTVAARGSSEKRAQKEAARFAGGEVITVREGALQGFEEGGALHWFGVPYAAPPVGELRWKAPQKAESWKGTRDATKTEGASQMGRVDGKIAPIGSEAGAVTLDITRPATSEDGLPIFFYIHGGNNQTGDSAALPATQLAQELNCVVVSINHRLGLQGFNALPAIRKGTAEEQSGNFGLLDIAAALDWVIANAASFGGDAQNITVSGSSAGGRNVMAMLISPLFKDKFQKAISFSGGMTTASLEESARVDAAALAPLALQKGAVSGTEDDAAAWLLTDSDEVRAFLYGLTDSELSSAFGDAAIRMSAFPHLFADGAALPKEGFDTKRYNDVPVLMVNGANEFSFFCISSAPFSALSSLELMASDDMLAQFRFAEKYGSMMYGYFNGEDSAERMLKAGYKSPIYTCIINWGTDSAIVGEEFATTTGSFHCMSTPLMTGVIPFYMPKEPFSSEGFASLGKMLNAYYKNFLHSGNPNGGGLPEWKSWPGLDGTTQLIVDADATTAFAQMSDEHTSYSKIIAMMEDDSTIGQEEKLNLIRTVLNGRWFSAALDDHFQNPSLWD